MGIKSAAVAVHHEGAGAAGREAGQFMLAELGRPPDLVITFVSGHLDIEAAVAGLRSQLPEGTPLVGCSSDVEVDTRGAIRGSVAALGLSLPGITARTFQVPANPDDKYAVGRAVGELLAGTQPCVVIAFPDVLEGNATGFLEALSQAIGPKVPIIGGAPGDGARFQRTFTILDGTIQRSGASGVALYGPIEVAVAALSGYVPLGAARTVTARAASNVLLELDGRSALEVYREYLGDRASEMPGVSIEFPIAVMAPAQGDASIPSEIQLVRAVFAIDEARGALILGGDVPERAVIRVARAVREHIVRGAQECVTRALTAMPAPELALVFSCASRIIAMGARYRDECRGAFAALPTALTKFGFYTFGELSPLDGVNHHHESTFTVALLRSNP